MLNDATGNFDLTETLRELEQEMLGAANNLEFEKAALLRDQIRELKRSLDGAAKQGSSGPSVTYKRRGGERGRPSAGVRKGKGAVSEPF